MTSGSSNVFPTFFVRRFTGGNITRATGRFGRDFDKPELPEAELAVGQWCQFSQVQMLSRLAWLPRCLIRLKFRIYIMISTPQWSQTLR